MTAPSGRRPSPRTDRAILAAWTVAVVATTGSLYYQFGMGLVPCELCWFQRVFMYPLVVVLGYAALVGQADVYRPALGLAVPGLLVAAYHSSLQAASGLVCSFAGCGVVQYRVGGLSIPNQSLLAFALVVGLLAVAWRDSRG